MSRHQSSQDSYSQVTKLINENRALVIKLTDCETRIAKQEANNKQLNDLVKSMMHRIADLEFKMAVKD